MCWSRDVSIIAFTFIVGSSLLLKYYGNSSINKYNNIICYFFIFVGLMQLIDFLIWIDVNCSKGYNKIATVLGMLLNYLQPFVLFMLVYYFTQKSIKDNNINTVKFAKYINYSYLVVIILLFADYIIKNIINNISFCSKVIGTGHIKWLWSDKYPYGYLLYNIVMIFNIYLIYTLGYNIVAPILSYILLFISIMYFKQNVGELWCFFVVIIPIIELIRQYLI
jgi:hypothetical protein